MSKKTERRKQEPVDGMDGCSGTARLRGRVGDG